MKPIHPTTIPFTRHQWIIWALQVSSSFFLIYFSPFFVENCQQQEEIGVYLQTSFISEINTSNNDTFHMTLTDCFCLVRAIQRSTLWYGSFLSFDYIFFPFIFFGKIGFSRWKIFNVLILSYLQLWTTSISFLIFVLKCNISSWDLWNLQGKFRDVDKSGKEVPIAFKECWKAHVNNYRNNMLGIQWKWTTRGVWGWQTLASQNESKWWYFQTIQFSLIFF